MDRTRICVTGLRGIPGVMGGVETHCEELLPRVAALAPDLEIEVLVRRRFVDPSVASYRGVRITPLPSPGGTSTETIGATAMAVLHAARHGARLIHIHAVGPALVAPLARALGMRVVMTHHGRDYDRAKWGPLARSMLRLGERLGILNAHRVIAVAPSLAEQLKQAYPSRADAIQFVPNGAPDLQGDEDAREVLERFGLAPGKYILTVGRLVPEKGFDYLVRAFRRSVTDRRLVIVGSAIHDSAFARDLLREADESVRFIGTQSRGVLRRLYEHADLYVLPSFHEGLAISALEAARCGTPMLLSDIRPNRDIGLPSVNYFRVGDEDELARKLALGGSAFAYDVGEVRARFDWDKIAAGTLSIYREVLAEVQAGATPAAAL